VDITRHAEGHMIIGYRVIKEWLDELVEIHGIKRLQAYVEPGHPERIRMVQHLGFERESILEKFLGDKDAYLYKRII
jgi:RimJ/RimL family protein N-acetyltransferase